jgi:F-type H+-transporting ATPase subunit c
MLYLLGIALGVGFGVSVAAFGCGLGQGRAVAAALEGTARQPEAGGRIMVMMILGLAFIESLTIYALIFGFKLMGMLPQTADVMKLIAGAK